MRSQSTTQVNKGFSGRLGQRIFCCTSLLCHINSIFSRTCFVVFIACERSSNLCLTCSLDCQSTAININCYNIVIATCISNGQRVRVCQSRSGKACTHFHQIALVCLCICQTGRCFTIGLFIKLDYLLATLISTETRTTRIILNIVICTCYCCISVTNSNSPCSFTILY